MHVDMRPANTITKPILFLSGEQLIWMHKCSFPYITALIKCNFTVTFLLNNQACDQPCMWPTHTQEFHYDHRHDALGIVLWRSAQTAALWINKKKEKSLTSPEGSHTVDHVTVLCAGDQLRVLFMHYSDSTNYKKNKHTQKLCAYMLKPSLYSSVLLQRGMLSSG